jgi:hypothetical protein
MPIEQLTLVPVKRKLSPSEVKKLAKGFRKKGVEPANHGVAKKIGRQMFRAVADQQHKRVKAAG